MSVRLKIKDHRDFSEEIDAKFENLIEQMEKETNEQKKTNSQIFKLNLKIEEHLNELKEKDEEIN